MDVTPQTLVDETARVFDEIRAEATENLILTALRLEDQTFTPEQREAIDVAIAAGVSTALEYFQRYGLANNIAMMLFLEDRILAR